MAKRALLALTLLSLCAFSAFSLSSGKKKNPPPKTPSEEPSENPSKNSPVAGFSMSAGVNGDFMALFRSMEIDGQTYKYNRTGGGFGVFFDATYAEIGLGMDFTNGKNPDVSGSKGFDATYFSISLLGKYPIALSEKLTLFPLLGFDWNIFTAGENKNTHVKTKRDDLADDYKDSNDLFLINLGAGADFALNDKLYVRGSFLYGFKLNSKSEQETVDDYNAKIFTSGPALKAGVGYKF